MGALESRKISREELHELVWSVPVRQASRLLGVSGSYVGRICTALDVPRPGRGWWAQKRAGCAPAPTPLPNANLGHPLFWEKGPGSNAIFTYYKDRDLRQKSREIGWHPLALIAQRSFSKARPGRGDLLVVRANGAIDLSITASMLDAAIQLANMLFIALEASGSSVAVAVRQPFIRPAIGLQSCLADWQREVCSHTRPPRWPTIATIAGVPTGLAIVELHHEAEMQYIGDGQFAETCSPKGKRIPPVTGITWKQERLVSSKKLKIVAYSPVHSSPWRQEWQIDDPRTATDDIKEIILKLEIRAQGQEANRASCKPALPKILSHSLTAVELVAVDSLVAIPSSHTKEEPSC
ncbi:hypothetical protein [Rhizobium sp. NRK18]|uniref:hypothetical protein n=1 Tax=Rhizobium sp. NRK18 TaxID=2964667 RepID=UPI0021C4018D|nr:hypothetical protein [Rhizobium sp. NRK18]MCQ2003136.1 hypothetical protein [Rhizobium sp. NRK18]